MPRQSVQNPSISAGDLVHQVQLASDKGGSADSFGQPSTSWTPYLTTRAAIRNLSGQELYQAAEFSSAAQVRVTIRWPGASIVINTGDRVLFGDHAYVIQIVDNVLLRNRIVNLNCLEIDGTS
jgi:SPP1 family predicted phage head-tail adaptor